MNSNNLRIRSSDIKTRNTTCFDPVVISDCFRKILNKNEVFDEFLEAKSEKQISIIKQILFRIKDNCTYDTVHFLVIVYLEADIKHPAKSMISRYVTKNDFIQKEFTELLTKELDNLINKPCTDYNSFVHVITKVTSCIENFPSGAAAVQNLEINLAEYFKNCLYCCISTLSDDSKALAPTEKNEIFTLVHSTLRLLLHIIQKIREEKTSNLIALFGDIRISLKYLICDEDAPMDTKSVCGLLYVSMHVVENNSDSWIDILESGHNDDNFKDIFSDESAKLCIYSALVTVIPTNKLKVELPTGEPAIIKITKKILEIGERRSWDAAVSLAVCRALAAVSAGAGAALLALAVPWLCGALEAGADAVQHAAALALRRLVRRADLQRRDGNEEVLDALVAQLGALDRERKSFYVGVCALGAELGAERALRAGAGVRAALLAALRAQPVQAAATTALETLLQKHIQSASTDVIFEQWIEPILSHVNDDAVDSSVLNILENLLVLALKLNSDLMDHILPRIQSSRAQTRNLLVCVSALRRAGGLQRVGGVQEETEGCWKGVLSYELLEQAAVDCSEQNRILCISLIVESPKSTEIFTKDELDLVLWFLQFNINAQQPHFRQLLLSILKRFIKRLESSYGALIRENDPTGGDNKSQYYLTFIDRLEELCYDSLLQGANYSRRYVALQLLVWTAGLTMTGYVRRWQDHQIETLLYHLGDSYENNKALALELLCRCPVDMMRSKKYSTSLELKDILAEASSVKPTDCVTAVYKLKLLRSALPEKILPGTDSHTANNVKLSLLTTLLDELEGQLGECERSLVLGARRAPMYGVLHCIALGVQAVSPYGVREAWARSVRRVLSACVRVCATVRAVLTCAAPEGHLPTAGHMGHIPLEDGHEVTAQMVLLCAWRSIKEVSLILSTLVTQALTHDEFKPATLRSTLVRQVGEMFTTLLTETKHRGAFEQVYVGFTRMLTSLWRSRNPEFNSLPKLWLEELLSSIESGDPDRRLCSTRRSAGLPFMIQALVITELQVHGNPGGFEACTGRLLRLAGAGADDAAAARTRCHALNVLRALLRDRGLTERGAPCAADALLLALRGFERRTWLERNSATLLFSALMVRIFGVQRNKDSENLCVRNRMTGRIFFLKYPKLYDFMLEKLKEAHDDNEESLLRPSLYPILLLLARLYPSSLEGTVSNLKLTAFVPLVRACARSAVLTARRLAARAAPALAEPERYIPHIEEMYESLSDMKIKRNYCHGILLQLIKLLEAKPDKLAIDKSKTRLLQLVEQSSWILRQSVGGLACYPIADEYIKMINILIWRFDGLIEEDFINKIQITLNNLIFKGTGSKKEINPGRELCLANAAYLRLIISHRYEKNNDIRQFVYKCLAHKCYEVTLTALNYLLILYGVFEVENSLQEHLREICSGLEMFESDSSYTESLCRILKSSKYLECTQKCLKLLTLKRDTAKIIIQAKMDRDDGISDDFVIDKLLYYIENEHENLMHFYLGNLCNFLCAKMAAGDVNESKLVKAMNVIFSCSLPHNNDETRTVVVEFLENSLKMFPLLDIHLKSLSEEEKFSVLTAWWGCAAAALHDDEEALRARAAAALAPAAPARAPVAPLAARAALRACADVRRLAALALLDWKAEVCASDALDEQTRVFDQNERYNIYLEETFWSRDCARKIKEICDEKNLCEYIYDLINVNNYRETFENLCGDNLIMFEKSIRGYEGEINPKVKIFVDTLETTQ
ncbi:thyroid adenoma-associated protein homolog [Vanessa atalanta]|uniref:thyroid adenoma-associated protein homolog n=1 Tax=Vanessa atalanta TaxID=42275 RepID=UPI001FCE1899|nr:thyroid adenoma-associated protein homolog [Vanessa atalanta]